jgi:hypothetical protein
MSITLTIITIIYVVIGFFFHRECIKLKAEYTDGLWEGVDKNDWWVELIFIICSLFWPICLLIGVFKKKEK